MGSENGTTVATAKPANVPAANRTSRAARDAGTPDGTAASQTAAVLPGFGLTAVWEYVTPQLAQLYLSKNFKRNRRHMPSVSKGYRDNMTGGTWEVTGDPLRFNVDGELVDGQHRLQAIIDSGIPQWCLIVRGVSHRAVRAIDRGRGRSLAHALQIAGIDAATSKFVAAARVMMFAPHLSTSRAESTVTDTQMAEFIADHSDAITFGTSLCQGIKGIPMVVGGMFGRASYHEEPDRIRRFALAVADKTDPQDVRPEDVTARKLATVIRETGNSSVARQTIYRKAQNALRHWLDGKAVGMLYERQEDLFPLPKGEEKEADTFTAAPADGAVEPADGVS